jgi:hypothetical protein
MKRPQDATIANTCQGQIVGLFAPEGGQSSRRAELRGKRLRTSLETISDGAQPNAVCLGHDGRLRDSFWRLCFGASQSDCECGPDRQA